MKASTSSKIGHNYLLFPNKAIMRASDTNCKGLSTTLGTNDMLALRQDWTFSKHLIICL